MSDVILDPNIFNTQKTYSFNTGSLFLQQQPGLIDTINRGHPEIFKLYKLLKSLDWDENEFPMNSCIAEFQTCSRDQYEIMVKTLAWQWEADSIAAHSIAPVVAPFVSSSDLWAAWLKVSENEVVHGLAYSEIVKGSFVDHVATFSAVLGEVGAYRRLSAVARTMANTSKVSAQLRLGLIRRDSKEARDAIMLFTVAMLLLERVQFMSSFAITFAFGEAGQFMPIAKTVQKICNEEFNVHVKLDRLILRNELQTKEGRESFERIRPIVEAMYIEVGESELAWTRDRLFTGNRQLAGVTAEMICDWVQFGLTDVHDELGLMDKTFKTIRTNPLDYMSEWIDIDNTQSSPQEEKTGNYLIGGFSDTTNDKVFSIDDL